MHPWINPVWSLHLWNFVSIEHVLDGSHDSESGFLSLATNSILSKVLIRPGFSTLTDYIILEMRKWQVSQVISAKQHISHFHRVSFNQTPCSEVPKPHERAWSGVPVDRLSWTSNLYPLAQVPVSKYEESRF